MLLRNREEIELSQLNYKFCISNLKSNMVDVFKKKLSNVFCALYNIKITSLAIAVVLFVISVNIEGAQVTKKTNVAGAFYTADPVTLQEEIKDYFSIVTLPSFSGRVLGVISPHAGYIYSGPVAAYSYKVIEDFEYDLAVVLAPSHYYPFTGASVYSGDAFATPLGNLQIDSEAVEFIAKNTHISADNSVFEQEHSLEVQLPFLKYAKPDIKIVPIIFGQATHEQMKSIAITLEELSKIKNILVITSTDLSHFHSYDKANEIDNKTISYVEALDSDGFVTQLMAEKCEACGYAPLLTIMEYFKLKGANVKVLKYANSGDTAGDKARVVGYVSIAGLVSSEPKNSSEDVLDSDELDDDEKKLLLNIARKTLEQYLDDGTVPVFEVKSERLNQVRGAFVTLHKNGELRGCIGNYGHEPLYETIINMAIASATQDTRFQPLRLGELKEIDIEISALSPLKRVKSAEDIILGKHGVIVKKGFRQGVFLPQVADETGWNKDEFLSYLCLHKAGLSADAWKDSTTELTVFTADVFSEKKIN